MLWLPLLVGHQQSWLCAIRMYFSSLRKVFNGLWQLDLEEWYKMRIYLYAPPQFNLYSCFLLLPLHATPYTYARKHTHIHMHTSRSRSTLSRSDSISMSILFITNKSVNLQPLICTSAFLRCDWPTPARCHSDRQNSDLRQLKGYLQIRSEKLAHQLMVHWEMVFYKKLDIFEEMDLRKLTHFDWWQMKASKEPF